MEFSRIVGEVLRDARLASGLTLGDVEILSRGRFKRSSTGGYERGERTISLARFCELATYCRVPADRLLARALNVFEPGRQATLVIDLNRVSSMKQEEARAVADFIHRIRIQRGDYLSDVITLRSGDAEKIAFEVGVTPNALLKKLRPTLLAKGDDVV